MALPAESNNSIVEQVSLIDILYKDISRIDSYISQITHGILKRRKLKETNTQTNIKKVSGGLPSIFTGDYTDNNQDMTTEELNFIPHDYNVIDLLDRLDLSPIETFSDEEIAGRIVWLKGRLSVRDFKKISDMIPAMADNPDIFKINEEEAGSLQKMFKAMEKIFPFNLEVECFLKDNSLVRGFLNESYLITPYQDIVAMHGHKLPGCWNVVGILDSLNREQIPNNQYDSLRFSVDSISSAIKKLYSEGNLKYSITPILIFRGLEK